MSVASNNQRDSKHSINLNLNNGREHLDPVIKNETNKVYSLKEKKERNKRKGDLDAACLVE